MAVFKLSESTGALQNGWPKTYPSTSSGVWTARKLLVDDSGNIYIAGDGPGTTGQDYYVLKYTSCGGLDTGFGGGDGVVQYDGGVGDDIPVAMVLTDQGQAYGQVVVTGRSKGSYGGGTRVDWDYLTIGYDMDDGAVALSAKRYDNGGNDTPADMAVQLGLAPSDDALNAPVYITGTSWDSTGGKDYYTVEYGHDGSVVASDRWNSAGNGEDEAQGIFWAVFGAWDEPMVVVTGFSDHPGDSDVPTADDYLTIMYQPDLTESWASYYDGSASGNAPDYAFDVAALLSPQASASFVFVTGCAYGSSGGYNLTTIKYDWTDGSICWVDEADGGGSGADGGAVVQVASDEDPQMTGFGVPFGGNTDILTRVDPSASCGNVPGGATTFSFNGPGNGTADGGNALVLSGNNTYVGGTVHGGTVRLGDVAVIKYGP